MRFSYFALLLVMLICSSAAVAQNVPASASAGGKFDDPAAVEPQISSKDFKLPKLWDLNILPQYRLRAAHVVVKDARLLAMKNLMSQVGDIQIDDKTRLSDMFKKSDTPNIEMIYFLRGIREGGLVYRTDCLVAEVQLEISLKAVLGSVKCWLEDHLTATDKAMVIKLRDKIESLRGGELRAIGVGCVPIEYIKPAYRPIQEKVKWLFINIPRWVSLVPRVIGEAPFNPDDDTESSRDQAFAEAAFDARKKLQALVEDLPVVSNAASYCTLKQFVSQNDEMRRDFGNLIMTAGLVKNSELIIADKAEAAVSVPLKKFWNLYIHYRLAGIDLPKVDVSKASTNPAVKQ